MADGITVTASGDGPVLLCLHGLLGSGAQFGALSGLTDRYRVAAWDAPGYGGSAAAGAGAGLDWYVRRAGEAAEEAGAGAPVHLLGTGWGGVIAMALATAHPELVRSVIIADPAPGGGIEAGGAGAGHEQGPAALAAEGAARLVSPSRGPQDVQAIAEVLAQGMTVEGYAAAAGSLAGADVSDRLRGLLMPSMVVAGEDAGAEALQRSQEIASAIPEAVFVTMHGAGGLTHLENPATFTAWTRSFLYIVDRVREEALS